MLFRQLFDPETSTYTYVLADESSRDAVVIDPVREQFERDLGLIRELDLVLRYVLDTHVHADHVTAAGRFRDALGAKIGVGARAGVEGADAPLEDGERVRFGDHVLEVWHTPGHTAGCVTYVCRESGLAFTGDVLLVRGCGRTDFQAGNARALFHSVRERIFSLPDETLLYPGHDYKGRTVTSVGEEKRFNARLALARSESEFVEIMGALELAYPRRMDEAVPANLRCGLGTPAQPEVEAARPPPVAGVMETLGRQDAEMWLGLGI